MSITLRKKILKDGRQSLYLDHYGEEGRRKEFLKLYLFKRPKDENEKQHNKETLKLAENILTKSRLQTSSEEHGFGSPIKKKINFIEYFENYAATYQKKNVRTVEGALRYFKAYLGERTHLRPNEVTESLCHGFKEHLEQHLYGETPATYFARFKQVLRQAVRDKIFPASPAADVQNKASKGQVRKDVLTVAEIKQLAATHCGNETVRRAFLFSCMTGLRFVDIVALRWKHVDETAIRVLQSKTDLSVMITLNATARILMGERKEPDAPVFEMPTANGTNKNLRTWAGRAGLSKHLSYHVARHSFACNLLLNATDLHTVSNLLGHSDLTHTTKYLRTVESMKQQAVNRLEFDLSPTKTS